MKKGMHIINPIKPKKYTSPYYFSICIQYGKPKIEIIFLTPESSAFVFFLTNSGQKSLTIFISSCFNNYSIYFFKNWEIKKQSGFGATEHLCNRL